MACGVHPWSSTSSAVAPIWIRYSQLIETPKALFSSSAIDPGSPGPGTPEADVTRVIDLREAFVDCSEEAPRLVVEQTS